MRSCNAAETQREEYGSGQVSMSMVVDEVRRVLNDEEWPSWNVTGQPALCDKVEPAFSAFLLSSLPPIRPSCSPPTITSLIIPRITTVALAATLACLSLSVAAVMTHTYDLSLYTYFDVKIVPGAADQILAWTTTASSAENGSLAGVEYIGHVGELDNHLLYRVPKPTLTTTPASASSVQSSFDDGLEEQRNNQIVNAIAALQGVLHVDIQTPRQRTKRDEL
ncbi:hypothetical protein B0O80DRAFT_519364 [Mortierella sp. GBAus27b]|nr:hypothetical protein B0O80DRAFT_519364 [Mortierella sp. GBAus27b]